MHIQHNAYATVIVPVVTPIRHLLGAPHGIASVGCWTGTGFGTEEETHWAMWFTSMAGFLIMSATSCCWFVVGLGGVVATDCLCEGLFGR